MESSKRIKKRKEGKETELNRISVCLWPRLSPVCSRPSSLYILPLHTVKEPTLLNCVLRVFLLVVSSRLVN